MSTSNCWYISSRRYQFSFTPSTAFNSLINPQIHTKLPKVGLLLLNPQKHEIHGWWLLIADISPHVIMKDLSLFLFSSAAVSFFCYRVTDERAYLIETCQRSSQIPPSILSSNLTSSLSSGCVTINILGNYRESYDQSHPNATKSISNTEFYLKGDIAFIPASVLLSPWKSALESRPVLIKI